MTESVLAVEGATKSFPGVKALDGVDFVLRPGEIHALLGENGAGKSTLIKILTGVHLPDSGTVRLFGEPVRFRNARAAIQAGISAVHQERNLIPRMSVAENIMLEDLPERLGFVDYAAVNERARHWIERLGLAIRPDQSVRTLSVAQMQLVEIAKALVLEAKILLMDEPTASITPHETEVLFGLLRQLKGQGAAIVFVSHKLEEVFELCDRVTVLRDGRNACNGLPIGELDRGDVVRFMIGRDERTARLGDKPVDAATVALRLAGVATSLGHAGIDLELRRGEILGLYGLVGAGRSELAKALVGLGRITGGTVEVAGKAAAIPDPTTALQRYRIGYVSEDRKGEGLILIHDVGRNIGITIWRRLSGWLGWLGEGKARAPPGPSSRSSPSARLPWARRSATSRAATSRRSPSPSGWPRIATS
ncbi:MAG: sugar ABC transporter ATP-binding protein [Geminicoccaceae bacterium]